MTDIPKVGIPRTDASKGKSQSKSKVIHWHDGVERIGPAICAIGAFDGVHEGHRYLIGEMTAAAKEADVASVVVTFDVDPDELLATGAPPHKLLSNVDRIELLARLGATHVLVVPFTREMAALPYEEFLGGVLGRFMEVKGIHVGCDFRFGRGAQGTVDAISDWGLSHKCDVCGYELLLREGHPVTATRIRELLREGDAATSARMLGRPFYVRGEVVEGRHEGRKIGFPTANVSLDNPYIPLADGVYAGWCSVDGQCLPAAINVGYPPTFEGERVLSNLEPHIVDFSGDLYGRQIAVSFMQRLRPTMRFDSVEALSRTIASNASWVRENLLTLVADPLGFPLDAPAPLAAP